MSRKFLTHIDLAKNELQNAVIQQLGSAPSSPVQGQIYYNTGDDNLYVYDGSDWVDLTLGGSGTGDVSSNTGTSVDSEVALFSGTGGKTIKRATGTGMAKLTSGVLSTGTAGTDYTTPSSTETFTNKTFNANGTGNTISNIEVADFAAGVVDTDLSSTSASDDTVPSAKATKAALDLKAPLASPSFTGTVTLPTGLTGVLRADSGVVSTDTDVTDLVSSASTTVAGVVELATTAETETGTDTTRAVTPDGLHDMTTLAGAAWFLDEDNMASDSATKTASQQSIKAYADTKSTASKTETLTNKTIDANGTGNSISNLEVADLAAGVLNTSTSMSGASDTQVPSALAIKTYTDNIAAGIKWKQEVRVATTAAGTLASSFEDGDTVDGVTLATGDRILIKDQSSGSENGIYVVAASGAPTRATDADSAAELRQATVFVQEGTVNADSQWVLTNDGTITLNTTALVWALAGNNSIVAASTTVAGKVELATLAEAEAKTDTVRALTAASVANFPIKKTFTIGDGSTTAIACTHSLGTKDVLVQIRQASDDAVVEADIVNTSTSVTTITFATAPATNAIKVVIVG